MNELPAERLAAEPAPPTRHPLVSVLIPERVPPPERPPPPALAGSLPIKAMQAGFWAAQAAIYGISPGGSLRAYLYWLAKLAIVIGLPVLLLASGMGVLIYLAEGLAAIAWALLKVALCGLGVLVVLVVVVGVMRGR